jgi:hypothetical protein
LSVPSPRQLEKHIRASAASSSNVILTNHAKQRMKERNINDPMVMDVLRSGRLALPPEPDMKHPGLMCRMQRLVAGVNVAVVVYVEHPAPNLTVVTVIDVRKD